MTAGDVMQLSREMLADTGVTAAGERFTNTVLRPFLQAAHREINSVAVLYGLPVCLRHLYRYLDAYRDRVDLVTNVEFVFNDLYDVYEALPLSVHTVTTLAVEAGSGDGQQTALLRVDVDPGDVSTSLHRGAKAVLTGVTGAPKVNGEWVVTAVSPASPIYALLNCDESPSGYVATYAKLGHIQGDFYPIYLATPGDHPTYHVGRYLTRREYFWEGGQLTIPASYKHRFYKVSVFALLPDPSADGDVVPWIGGENFLAARTASLAVDPLAGGSQDASPVLADRLDIRARGANRESDGSGGFLADWLGTQRIRLRMPPVTPPVAGR